MRIFEKEYDKYKEDNKDSIILLKKVNRYYTYMVDALMISKLANMIMDGFELIISIKEMEYIKPILDNKNINYIIYDKNNIIKKEFDNNYYYNFKDELKSERIF